MSTHAWGWVAHLREGGTTPWALWPPDRTGLPGGRFPGAAQLELLRRLNLAGFRGLPERVLAARPAGRGRGDLVLAGEPHPGYGDPAVDPAGLPDHDLVRVAADLLGESLGEVMIWLASDLATVLRALAGGSASDHGAGEGQAGE